MVSETRSCNMGEGTCKPQLLEVVGNLKGETSHLKDEQVCQWQLLEIIFQQLSNHVASYDQLVLTVRNANYKECSSGNGGNNLKLNDNPLLEGHGGV